MTIIDHDLEKENRTLTTGFNDLNKSLAPGFIPQKLYLFEGQLYNRGIIKTLIKNIQLTDNFYSNKKILVINNTSLPLGIDDSLTNIRFIERFVEPRKELKNIKEIIEIYKEKGIDIIGLMIPSVYLDRYITDNPVTKQLKDISFIYNMPVIVSSQTPRNNLIINDHHVDWRASTLTGTSTTNVHEVVIKLNNIKNNYSDVVSKISKVSILVDKEYENNIEKILDRGFMYNSINDLIKESNFDKDDERLSEDIRKNITTLNSSRLFTITKFKKWLTLGVKVKLSIIHKDCKDLTQLHSFDNTQILESKDIFRDIVLTLLGSKDGSIPDIYIDNGKLANLYVSLKYNRKVTSSQFVEWCNYLGFEWTLTADFNPLNDIFGTRSRTNSSYEWSR